MLCVVEASVFFEVVGEQVDLFCFDDQFDDGQVTVKCSDVQHCVAQLVADSRVGSGIQQD